MKTPEPILLGVLAPLFFTACQDATGTACVRGSTERCSCPAELAGERTCGGDGTFGECRCGALDGGAPGGDGGGGADGGGPAGPRMCNFGGDIAIGLGPAGTAPADIDGDGDLDFAMAVGTSPTQGTRIAFNDDEDFSRRVMLPCATDTCGGSRVAAGDLNGDGAIDLVSASNDRGLWRERWVSDRGSVSEASVTYNTFVYLNRGDGTFDLPQRLLAYGNVRGILIGDFTGDDLVDIVIGAYVGPHSTASQPTHDGDRSCPSWLFANNGDATFGRLGDYSSHGAGPEFEGHEPTAGRPHGSDCDLQSVTSADVDGDGVLEAAVARRPQPDDGMWFNRWLSVANFAGGHDFPGGGNFINWAEENHPSLFISTAYRADASDIQLGDSVLADIDGDRQVDIISPTNIFLVQSLELFLVSESNGDGLQYIERNSGQYPLPLAGEHVRDIDGSGLPDLWQVRWSRDDVPELYIERDPLDSTIRRPFRTDPVDGTSWLASVERFAVSETVEHRLIFLSTEDFPCE